VHGAQLVMVYELKHMVFLKIFFEKNVYMHVLSVLGSVYTSTIPVYIVHDSEASLTATFVARLLTAI
jgi:hypothetical protein